MLGPGGRTLHRRPGPLARRLVPADRLPHGPLAPYLLGPFAAFTTSHTVLLWALTLYNLAAIPLMYALGRDLFGRAAGLIAAALFAVNPWLVMYDRWLMNNAVVAPTTVF